MKKTKITLWDVATVALPLGIVFMAITSQAELMVKGALLAMMVYIELDLISSTRKK